MKYRLSLFALAFTLFASPLFAAASTAEVWEHHIQTWNARDLDGIVADYTDDSVIIRNNKTFTGKEQIREFFRGLFHAFDGAKDHHIDPAVVSGKVVYIAWHAVMGGDYTVGSDTFVVEDGRITYQTIFASADAP